MLVERIDKTSPLQKFDITQGTMRVSDPCYAPGTWCAGVLGQVKTGRWRAHVGYHRDALDLEMQAKRLAQLEKDAQDPKLGFLYKGEIERVKEYQQKYTGRVAYLHVVHGRVEPIFDPKMNLDTAPWEIANFAVGVDSGQAGFFDDGVYDHQVDYDAACQLTDHENGGFGCLHSGAVSSSGWGDGGYPCYYRRNERGQVIEAVIVYLCQDEEVEL